MKNLYLSDNSSSLNSLKERNKEKAIQTLGIAKIR